MKRLIALLALSASAASTPVFEWDFPADPSVLAFRLYRRTDAEPTPVLAITVGRTNAASPGAVFGTNYFTVRAVGSTGKESLPSVELKYVAAPTESPVPVPQGFRLRAEVINRPPSAVNGAAVGPKGSTLTLSLSGSDPDGDPLTFTVFSGPIHGTVTGMPPILLYTPNSGWTGTDQIGFTVSDGTETSGPAFYGVVITP